ncbi:MAG: class III signal peptide-containing protein [Candidatus Omnitrophica bacterium]|nr:class III signal peptide-containing protein [Candidatus Omnitrophota bacterium]
MLKLLRNKKGQSTLEYILLITAVIAVAIIFLNPTTGQFGRVLNDTQNTISSEIDEAGVDLAGNIRVSL